MPGALSLFGNQIGKGLTPVPPPPLLQWTLGPLWSISVICAKQGTYGLQRTANGVDGSSDVTSTAPFDVTAGETLFTSFWVKRGVNADGYISFGYLFYDVNGVFLSAGLLPGPFPSGWTQYTGNIVVPNLAVSAVPVVRSTSHLHGFFCVDSVLSTRSGGRFSLSSIKHYFSDFTAYR